MPEIVSRREARIRGLSRFYTGQSCTGGHIAERLTSSGVCVVCSLERKRRWRKANPEKAREYARAWRAANPEKARECARRYREAKRAAKAEVRAQE